MAVFGGGCFWCTEAVFKMMKGVVGVEPGYSGGTVEHPTYEQVSSGQTGHAEVTRVEYDPKLVRYEDLLTVFFGSHDPTTLNRQGHDVGPQYRSAIFYTTPEQRRAAAAAIADIDGAVTEIVPLEKFYPAEDYHKNFYERNQGESYCRIVINPKLEKVKKKFASLLKTL